MRKDPLITGQYYHIYNRGVDKRDIFMNKKDLERFILGVKKFNRIDPVGSISNDVKPKKAQIGVGHLSGLVSIVCYCFNPNHFHFIVKQEGRKILWTQKRSLLRSHSYGGIFFGRIAHSLLFSYSHYTIA